MSADALDGASEVARRPGVAAVPMEGEAVLYDDVTGALHLLEPVAAVVWAHLDGTRPMEQLASELSLAYGAEQRSPESERNVGLRALT